MSGGSKGFYGSAAEGLLKSAVYRGGQEGLGERSVMEKGSVAHIEPASKPAAARAFGGMTAASVEYFENQSAASFYVGSLPDGISLLARPSSKRGAALHPTLPAARDSNPARA
jgi:hypothetical protein